VSASENMARELSAMVDHEQKPPCAADPGAWVSEDHTERAQAARLCAGCQLLDPCNDLADELHVRFGTWGGRDRTPRPRGG